MALRGKEKSFEVAPEPLQQFDERCFVRIARHAILFRENPLGLDEIMSVSSSLDDEIKAMNRSAPGPEKFRDRIKTSRKRIVFEMLED